MPILADPSKEWMIWVGVFGLAAVCSIIAWVVRRLKYYRNRAKCQHCQAWTTRKTDGREFKQCPNPGACCDECRNKHLKVEEQNENMEYTVARNKDLADESDVICPCNGGRMTKKYYSDHDIILHRCSSCKSVFIDGGELLDTDGEPYEDCISTGIAMVVVTE